MDEEDGKEVKRRSLDLPTPSKEKYVAKRARRSSIALSGPCGGASVEKRRTFHGKQRKPDHDKKKSQRKTSKFLMIERKIDPLNLMSISQKAGNNSPKVDSPQIGDRGSNFDPDNLRPVDLSDPLKLNNLDDNLLAVKVNSHKRKRKRRRRRTYSENDKDVTALLESIGHDGDTEQSDNEESSPNKLDVPKEEEKSRSVCEKSNNVEQGRTQMDINELIVDDWTEVEPTEKDDTKAAETLFHEEKISNETNDSKPEKSVIQQNDSKNYNFKFREKDRKFQYGNYSRYYGYRNPNMSDDDRIEYLKKEWFEGKDCLDIGCNVGHLTLYIARHFSPDFMTGTDIDDSLIRSARRNIQHYISLRDPQAIKQSDFPISFPICLGPLAAPLPPEKEGKSFGFPYNISFKTVCIRVNLNLTSESHYLTVQFYQKAALVTIYYILPYM